MPSKAKRSRATAGQPDEAQRARHHQQTRRAHHAEVAEDYVEAIADLVAARGEARTVEIARRLGVTPVTVAKTLARLRRAGLVSQQPYRSVFLTERGMKMAAESKRRHQIVANFLVALGVPSPVAQGDAEGIEHHVSAETLRAFDEYIRRVAGN